MLIRVPIDVHQRPVKTRRTGKGKGTCNSFDLCWIVLEIVIFSTEPATNEELKVGCLSHPQNAQGPFQEHVILAVIPPTPTPFFAITL